MKDLLVREDNQKIIERIRKVTRDSKPLWGKMDAAGMLFHLQVPIRVSIGELSPKQSLIGRLFGKMALKEALSDKPFRKGVPTSNEFKPNSSFDLETEKEKLIILVSSLVNMGPSALGKNPHPFFGVLTPEEWNILTWKHLDHHLTQFGV